MELICIYLISGMSPLNTLEDEQLMIETLNRRRDSFRFCSASIRLFDLVYLIKYC